MPNSPPLLIAARAAEAELRTRRQGDAWPVACLMYAAAVMQLRHTAPMDKIEPDAFSGPQLHWEASRLLGAHGLLQKLIESILKTSRGPVLSAKARSVVQKLGPYVFARISFILESRPDVADGEETDPCITGNVGDMCYQLVPAVYGGGMTHANEPLKHRLMACFPDDGWAAQHQKVLPKHVRVLTGPTGTKFGVHYLEAADAEANKRLAARYAPRGLTIAAVPLHRELCMGIETIGESEDGAVFRMVESNTAQWPDQWEAHLHSSLSSCRAQNASLVVLPELMASPTVIDTCNTHIKNTSTEPPALLIGGSWHIKNGGGFRNRLTVYSCRRGEGLHEICHHDKFAPFVFKNLVEGNKPGDGFTFLVTSIGIIALGICKDWFFLGQSNTRALDAILEAAPTVAVAASMTSEADDLHASLDLLFRRERAIFVFANACGQVRRITGRCCAAQKRKKDVRSFIAAPRGWYQLQSRCHTRVTRQGKVPLVKAPCRNRRTGENTAIASILLKE